MPEIIRIPTYLKRCLWVSAASLAMALGIYATPLGHAIDLTLGDQVARLVATGQDHSEIVVVDIDESSMAKLSSQIGAWPYDRDVFAVANAYLLSAGVKAVAYDVLFSEARRGDEAFAKTLNEKSVLAAASLPYGGVAPDASYRKQLGLAAWANGVDWRLQTWQNLTLPREVFTERSPVGIISMGADADGIVRRVPLLHQVQGAVLPALTSVTLRVAGVPVELNPASGQLKVAGAQIPVDDEGLTHIRFPKDWQLKIVPFHEVLLAASGSTRYEALAATLRGKIIYIGSSSAILGDFAQTPNGRMAGLYLAAALPSMVKQGHLYKPRHWSVDAGLVLAILGLTWVAALRKVQGIVWIQAAMFPALITATIALAGLAYASGQKTIVLVPVLAGLFAQVLFIIWHQVWLFKRNQRLLVEKLAAEESNRLKGQFLAHMTHELRTPLTAILGFNNINWKSDTLGREDRVSNAEVIDRNSRHLLALINGILDQAKLEAGQVRILKQAESLHALVKDIVTTLRPLAQDKGLTLTAKLVDNTPDIVEMDAFRVRQILLNLVGNAVKFTPNGSVVLEVAWLQNQLTFDVIDTGPGLSAAQLKRLFVAFQQANETDAARHGGTGLGLTISKELAHLMGGSISVDSTVGVGTRFRLTLPAEVVKALPIAAIAQTSPAAAGPKLMNGTVLIADDADDLRGLAVIYLKRFGLTVLQAKNGQEAVDMASQQVPDVVLMDMEMPVLHGLEAVKMLRGAGFGRPILAMTAHGGEPHRTLALAAGCNDVLAKPVSQATLRAALDSALSASRNSRPKAA